MNSPVRLLLPVVAASLAFQASAAAQTSSLSTIGNEGSTSTVAGSISSGTEGNRLGVRLGDRAMLHVGLTAEGGYDTNVFYQPDNEESSPILRIIPSLRLTNAPRLGTAPRGVFFDLQANLLYREYLSDDPLVREQRAFNPTVGGLLEFSSGQAFSLSLADVFTRIQEPPYVPGTEEFVRDTNTAAVQLRYAPNGGRLQTTLRYRNILDFFEDETLDYASNMTNEGMIDVAWRWLPKTAVYLQATQGIVTYLDEEEDLQARPTSYPLRVMAGLRGLVTAKVSANLAAGYTAGFYQEGAETPTGWSNLALIAELTYAPSVLTRLTVGYRRDFRNSPVLGSFFDVDSPYLRLQQRIADRLNFTAFGTYEWRRFQGIVVNGTEADRTDNWFQAGAGLDYFIQEWIHTGLGYQLFLNRSDGFGGVDFTKQLITARVGVTY